MFPLLEKESDFIRVTSQYVGAGWGIVVLPHVGQEVLVVFANGELNEGHVIGCSYSEGADAPPPSKKSQWYTRAAHSSVFMPTAILLYRLQVF